MRQAVWAAAAIAAAWAGGAAAQQPGSPPGAVQPAKPPPAGEPVWVKRATGADVLRYFPRKALRARLNGRAMVSCVAAADGALRDCQVLGETPPGYGFGDSSRRMVQERFRLHPKMSDGAPVTGTVIRMPLTWMMPR